MIVPVPSVTMNALISKTMMKKPLMKPIRAPSREGDHDRQADGHAVLRVQDGDHHARRTSGSPRAEMS